MLIIPYPTIDPVALHLGSLTIRWYGISYVAGIMLGWRYGNYLIKKLQLPFTTKDFDDFIVYLTLGIVAGGRLGQVFFYNFDYYLHKPWEIFFIWQPGMSFHGGLIGVLTAMLLFTYKRRIQFLAFCDITAAAVTIGLGFGRIANFINGELYGHITDQPWGMVFPGAGPLPRHPSQLYEAFLEGLVLFTILGITSLKLRWPERRPGVQSGLFLVLYGSFRSLVEFVREPEVASYLDVTRGQWLSLPLIVIGSVILYHRYHQPSKNSSAATH